MQNIFKNTAFQIVAGLIIIVAVTWGSIAVLSRHSPGYSSQTVERKDLTETVSANGIVTSGQSVTLAFNMQGRVAAVYADVGSTTHTGQVLAALDTGSLNASLRGAEADVEAAKARLAALQRGARPEELALYKQKYSDALSALSVAMKNAYLQSSDAVTGKADTLFMNGGSVNPTINIRTQSQTEALSINSERLSIRDKLSAWGSALSDYSSKTSNGTVGATATDTVRMAQIAQVRAISADTLGTVKSYLDHLGTITGNMTTGNSGLSQSTINGYVAIINAASQEVTGATNAEQAADAAWSAARDSLALDQAGSSVEDIQAGQAAVDKANAAVLGLQSQLRQSYIVSPYDGMVTAMNVKVGEVYVPGISATEGVSVIGNGSFKIEAYVPETDVGKIASGNEVAVTFDAYGPSTPFSAHVTLVDPAETVKNGINAYKVTIGFDNQTDSRIKSGLSANAVISTKTVKGALSVPTRALIKRGADTFVLAQDSQGSGYVEQKVETGITTSDGFTEITSGLNEGDIIASFGAGQ